MADLPEDPLVLEAIRSQLGIKVTVGPLFLPKQSLLYTVMHHVERWLGHPVKIYTAESHVPEAFCLNFPEAQVVVISGGYMTRIAKLRKIMYDPSLGSNRPELIQQQVLETTALHSLRDGDPEIGVLLFQESLIQRNYLVADPIHFLLDTQALDSSASGMIEGIFSIIHEVGHANLDTASIINQMSVLSDSSLMQWMKKTMSDITWMTPELSNYILASAEEQQDTHFLGLRNLRRECYADIFAAQRLFTIASATTRTQGVHFSPIEFWASLYREFNAVSVMQRTKFLARISNDFPPSREDLLGFVSFPVAMGVRAHLLVIGLYTFVHPTFSEEYALSDDFFSQLLDAMSQQSMPTLEDCDTGMERALASLLDADVLSDSEVLARTASVLRRSAYARLDASTFLRTAQEFGVSTTQLDLLQALVDDPWEPNFDVTDIRRSFYVLTAESPNFEAPRLFYIPLNESPPAIVVFTSARTAAIWADGFASAYLDPSETLNIMPLNSYHAENIKTFIEENFGDNFIQVVEGTIAFDNLSAARDSKIGGEQPDPENTPVEIRKRKADALVDRYRIYTEDTKNPASLEQFENIVRLLEDI